MTHRCGQSVRGTRIHRARRTVARILALAGLLTGCGDESTGVDRGPGGAVRLDVTPATAWTSPGLPLPFVARAVDSAGRDVSVASIQWSTSAAQVVTISPGGVAQGVAAGSARITATLGPLKTEARLTVVPAARQAGFGRELQGLTDVSLLGVWADATAPAAVAVGQEGVVLHSTGSSWRLEHVPTSETLVGVWGTQANDLWTVGSAGVIAHYDGTTWAQVASPTTETLLDVFGLGPSDVYAVGTRGTILRYTGGQWQVMTTGDAWELWGIWGDSPTNLYAVGQNGVIVRYDGTRWTSMESPTTGPLFGLWGSSASDIWAVGVNGLVVHFDGTRWTVLPPPTVRNLFAVWGRGLNDVYAVGNTGVVIHYDGVLWRELATTATGQNLRGAWGDSQGRLVVAGWDGTVIRGDASVASWSTEVSSPALITVWSGGDGTVYAGGSGGALFRRAVGSGWGPAGLPPSQPLYGIHGSSSTNVIAVGDTGTIWRFNGTRWSAETSPRVVLLRSAWIPSANVGFIVGDRGTILEQRGTTWVPMTSGTTAFLRHVWGTSPSEVFAVGDSGLVLRYDGSQWRPMPTPTRELLRAIWGSGPDDVFAVGERGTILRYDGVRWYAMASGTDVAIRHVSGTSPVDVYAVGEGGLLLRFDGTRWSRLTSPTDALLIQAWAEPGQGRLYVVGTVTTVLRGERQ